MAHLELDGIAKSFGETLVLRDISLAIEEGETLVLLGSSGSGKTTLLRLIAGFEVADRGEVLLAGRSIGGLPPAERNFGMVFQHYALFPHLSVGENVAFGLESRGQTGREAGARVEAALEQVDLAGFGDRPVSAISGGQQQRVALARALAPEPELLLLDEPLSNLDPELRERTRQDLAATLDRIGITAVWVTHEQEEAFDVGTRVAVLNRGELEQVGPADDLYRRPATPFVASFVGRASVIRARLIDSERAELTVPGREPVSLPVFCASEAGGSGEEKRFEVEVYVRPEAWEIAGVFGTENSLVGEVTSTRFAGRENLVAVQLEAGTEVEVATERDLEPGDRVAIRIRSEANPPTAFPLERNPD